MHLLRWALVKQSINMDLDDIFSDSHSGVNGINVNNIGNQGRAEYNGLVI